MRSTKAVIYSENLRANVREIQKNLQSGVRLCCAVKANGYGNDAVNSARIFEELGAEYLAIAAVSEGIELRAAGIRTKLLLLSLASPSEFDLIVKNGITPLVFDEEYIAEFEKACKRNTVSSAKNAGHIKYGVFLAVDTGMGRIGCLPSEAASLAERISCSKWITLDGMITHFAVSDSISPENIAYTRAQYAAFMDAEQAIRARGINPGIRTCAASAASMAFPEFQLDMVRPGIILYGYYADEVTKDYLLQKGVPLALRPVMQFETEVCAIRRFSAGKSVSYGRTWCAQTDTDIAVLPVGYADGLLRRNSPGLCVTINGRAYPIVGRICMDQCMVDIGLNNPDVKRWDKAVLFGPKKDAEHPEAEALFDADDLARMTGTISYEIMTSIPTSRVSRVLG